MSIPCRKYANTHSFEWDDQRLTLEFTSESSMRPFSKEYRIGIVSVDFISVVPDRRSNKNPRLKWFDRLHAFENVESTKAWRGISNHLDSITGASQLSQDAREFILRAVNAEVKNAYEKTVLIKHFVMAMRVTVRVMAIASKMEEEEEDEEGNSSSSEMKWRCKMRGRRGDTCGLCGDGLPKQEVGLQCGHEFHLNCYKNWLKRSRQCPARGPQVILN